jgi:hypothetical protein
MEGGFRAWKEAGLPIGQDFKPSASPLVKCFHDPSTGTCQYLVIDPGTFFFSFV